MAAKDIDAIVMAVEQFVLQQHAREITTHQIGEMVEALKKLDEVAYIRFASVYRQFTDIPTFMYEIPI